MVEGATPKERARSLFDSSEARTWRAFSSERTAWAFSSPLGDLLRIRLSSMLSAWVPTLR